ncbi:hypothetical protein Y032_0026g1465 [Ancylostoma ceylanicum]|uniref:Uncharacterized protein n=1 Tax=Ancylostoma ceylanicum TaxID=53326 RepID=A0A016UWT6_9BILA|nr:hypothetical protein Y032_0026g1465 [Ancylostoma ceylanicum]
MGPKSDRTAKNKVCRTDSSATQTALSSSQTFDADMEENVSSNMSTDALFRLVIQLNKDPTVEKLLMTLSERFSRGSFSDYLESDLRSRSIVISGVAEAAGDLLPSERQADVEQKLSNILDIVKVECRPDKVLRMGTANPSKPRSIKVVLPSRRCWRTALKNARLLRSAGFPQVFIRRSMTVEERKKDFELRQEARARNLGKPAKEWVVFRGELKHVSELHHNNMAGNL